MNDTRLDALLREAIMAEELDSLPLENRVRMQLAVGERRRKRWRASLRWAATAVAAVFVLMAGGIGYLAYVRARIGPMYSDAAQDHFVEVVRNQRLKWRSDPSSLSEIAARPGVPVTVLTRFAPPGYHLSRGRLCRLNGQIFLHLVYTDGVDEVSVYLRQADTQPVRGAPHETVNGRPVYEADSVREHVACVVTHEVTAIVVSDRSAEEALSLARYAAKAL